MSRPVIALAGNPNCGKTTLFNRLTGLNAKVGNYPGVTVDRREGEVRLDGGRRAVLLDIPGTYSLSARTHEEQIAIRAIAGLQPYEEPDAVCVVVDGTQLARHLYLVLQVLELRLPTVVAVNMGDVLARHGMRVDVDALEPLLGVPVVPISASGGQGIETLRARLGEVVDAEASPTSGWQVPNGALAADLDAVAPAVPDDWARGDPERRRALASWALLSVDEDDELGDVPDALRAAALRRRRDADADGRDLDAELVGARYAWIDAHRDGVIAEVPSTLRRVTDAVDRVLIHPVFGFASFVVLMGLLFQALFSWSAPMIDAVDGGVTALGAALAPLLPEGLLRDFVTEGLIAGVGTVLAFLPQILLLFLFISVLEDSGYMARAAFLMDRVMKSIGLTGRAFVPMLSGFACAIPAVMATRTMERHRDRMLTMMVVPIMTCSARLPVYTLIISALFPAPDEPGGMVLGAVSVQAGLMVAMYLFSTVLALAAAAVLGRTVFRGTSPPLLLELPSYRMPSPRSVVRMMWERSRLFVSEAGTVILVCTIALWVLLSFPRDVDVGRDAAAEIAAVEATAAERFAEDADELPLWVEGQRRRIEREIEGAELAASWGGRLGHLIEPAIAPLGFDWKIGVGLIGAFAAREVFVSTLGVIYGIGEDVDEASTPLRTRLRAERWPDGRPVYTPLVGLSLMVFFALAAQCMSTLGVVRRETHSYRWPTFLFVYMTGLAWVFSFATYQIGSALGF